MPGACFWPSWCLLWQTLVSGYVGSQDQSEHPGREREGALSVQEPHCWEGLGYGRRHGGSKPRGHLRRAQGGGRLQRTRGLWVPRLALSTYSHSVRSWPLLLLPDCQRSQSQQASRKKREDPGTSPGVTVAPSHTQSPSCPVVGRRPGNAHAQLEWQEADMHQQLPSRCHPGKGGEWCSLPPCSTLPSQ